VRPPAFGTRLAQWGNAVLERSTFVGEIAVNNVIYIIGLVVVVIAVLSWLGLR
jgi:hypothetical protein